MRRPPYERIHLAAEVRDIDAHAAHVLGLPTALLMENAGRAIAIAARRIQKRLAGRVFVACGKGNNGGDGWVAARHLQSWNLRVDVATQVPPMDLKGDARAAALAALACDVRATSTLEKAGRGDVVIDAVLGTGVSKPAEGDARDLIRDVNGARERGAYVISVDLPSGVDADQPRIPDECVWADETVALHCLKVAHVQFPVREVCGRIRVEPIGLPAVYTPGPERTWLSRERVSICVPRRRPDSHKGTFGHVAVWAGSDGKSGAAMLACRAAIRAGAGLVSLVSSPGVLDRVLPQMPEIMGIPITQWDAAHLAAALAGKDVLVAGPGIARDESTGAVLAQVLSEMEIDSVLDADALNALAADRAALTRLASAKRRPIVTPHPAEMARLLDIGTEHVQRDRFDAAQRMAREFSVIAILKGAGTVIADPRGALAVNSTGSLALATAGTGDVLAGTIGGLLASGLTVRDAAWTGVWMHGRAGDLAAKGRSRGLIASDVVDRLPEALAELA